MAISVLTVSCGNVKGRGSLSADQVEAVTPGKAENVVAVVEVDSTEFLQYLPQRWSVGWALTLK